MSNVQILPTQMSLDCIDHIEKDTGLTVMPDGHLVKTFTEKECIEGADKLNEQFNERKPSALFQELADLTRAMYGLGEKE